MKTAQYVMATGGGCIAGGGGMVNEW